MQIKGVKVGFTNCYLLEINSGYLMIDVGYPGDYEKFRNRLKKKLDIEVKDIKYLLLTHHHNDHCGFASRILEYTNAIFIIHELALKFISKGEVEQESRPINRRMKFVVGIFEKSQ